MTGKLTGSPVSGKPVYFLDFAGWLVCRGNLLSTGTKKAGYFAGKREVKPAKPGYSPGKPENFPVTGRKTGKNWDVFQKNCQLAGVSISHNPLEYLRTFYLKVYRTLQSA